MTDRPFLGLAKVSTMRRDFDRLRKAIRSWDAEETEKAWDKCERWLGCLDGDSINARN